MSYKHALALTAFGIGAVLQGCGEDEKKEKECTVDCQDKCKDIDGYQALTKVGVYEENCGTCIETQLSVEGATPIEKWAKVLAASIATDATDDQKALPLQALQYCGAKQQATACGTPLDPVDHVSTKAGIDAAVLALGDPDCGFCYLLGAVTDCATGLTSLTACGNAPNFVCEQDYSCHDIAGAYDDLDPTDAAVNTVCKTCLDAEVTADDVITDPVYTDAFKTVTDANVLADVVALTDHLLHCGAEQDDSSCDVGRVPSGANDAAIRTDLLAGSAKCQVCVLMGEFVDDAEPTCHEIKTSLTTCGSTAAADFVCPDCADFAVGDANCNACLKEQNNDADWDAPTAYTEVAHFEPWLVFGTCGAVVAQDACGTADKDTFTGLTAADAFVTAIAAMSEDKCNACLNLSIAQAIRDNGATFVVGTFQAAMTACSA